VNAPPPNADGLRSRSAPPADGSTGGLWGGRFTSSPDAAFKAFNDSLPFDARLIAEDVEGSKAWAGAIASVGVITAEERDRLRDALDDILARALADTHALRTSGHEDVHAYVEHELVQRLGPLGKKLHTGRSRNDQVATDFRLWTRRAVDDVQRDLADLARALIDLADRHAATPFPGFTHLQLAQPVTLGHWALAYLEMLERDRERLQDARRRVNRCPLGSGALAGAAYPIDRDALAAELGFDGPTRNSLDAVSDRDFVLDVLAALATLAVHLSRLAEDLIVQCSTAFATVRMSDAVSTGSSLMPQKKNPDALELVRGKVGRIAAAHQAMLITLKALPLAYNKDMQEDKEGLFDAVDQTALCLKVAVTVVRTLEVDETRSRELAQAGYTNATDLADYLVAKGVPFREAHDIVGAAVNHAVQRDLPLEALPLDELQRFSDAIDRDVADWLALEAVLDKRNALGGAAPARVREAAAAARTRWADTNHP